MNSTEMILKYTSGEITLEETNAALKEMGAGVYLDPQKNVLTEAEMRRTVVGHFPEQANGWGLLDTGTGSFDKVRVVNGELENCDCGEMYALCMIADREYQVKGKRLVAPEKNETEKKEVLPKLPDLGRRTDLKNTVVRQETKSGYYDVTYDEKGYAVSAVRVKVG